MWLLVIVIAFFASLFDVTLFPSITIFSGTISSVLAFLLVFLVRKSIKKASIMLIFSTLFLSAFSQVPVIFILMPYFIIFILVLFLVNRRVIDRPTTLVSFGFFFILSLIAGLVQLLMLLEISLSNLFIITKSSFMTASLAALLYYIYNKINYLINPQSAREKVRVNI